MENDVIKVSLHFANTQNANAYRSAQRLANHFNGIESCMTLSPSDELIVKSRYDGMLKEFGVEPRQRRLMLLDRARLVHWALFQSNQLRQTPIPYNYDDFHWIYRLVSESILLAQGDHLSEEELRWVVDFVFTIAPMNRHSWESPVSMEVFKAMVNLQSQSEGSSGPSIEVYFVVGDDEAVECLKSWDLDYWRNWLQWLLNDVSFGEELVSVEIEDLRTTSAYYHAQLYLLPQNILARPDKAANEVLSNVGSGEYLDVDTSDFTKFSTDRCSGVAITGLNSPSISALQFETRNAEITETSGIKVCAFDLIPSSAFAEQVIDHYPHAFTDALKRRIGGDLSGAMKAELLIFKNGIEPIN